MCLRLSQEILWATEDWKIGSSFITVINNLYCREFVKIFNNVFQLSPLIEAFVPHRAQANIDQRRETRVFLI